MRHPYCLYSYTNNNFFPKLSFSKFPDHLCAECGKSFLTASCLKLHVLLHSKQPKKIVCEYCPLRFKRKQYYQEHLNYVHKGVKFVCNICGSKLSSLSVLKAHQSEYIKLGKIF